VLCEPVFIGEARLPFSVRRGPLTPLTPLLGEEGWPKAGVVGNESKLNQYGHFIS
jgi:hypothetical protein